MTQTEAREYIKHLHDNCGISYAHISRKTNISDSYIRKWIKENRTISGNCFHRVIEFIESSKESFV